MTCVSGLDQVRRGGRNSDTMHNTRVFLNRVCLQGLHVRFIVGLRVRFIVVPSSSFVFTSASLLVFTSASLSSRLHPLSRRSTLSLLASCRWSPSHTLQFSFTLYQVHCPFVCCCFIASQLHATAVIRHTHIHTHIHTQKSHTHIRRLSPPT